MAIQKRVTFGIFSILIAVLGIGGCAVPAHAAGATLTMPANDLGLTAYYPFSGGSLDWATNQATDESGNGNTGTLVNMSTTSSPVAGIVGQALQFNGSNQYISLGRNVIGQTLTWSAWVYVSSLSADRAILGGSNGGPEFRIDKSGNLQFLDQNTAVIATSVGMVPVNKWTHVVLTYDSSGNYRFYIDGSAAGSGTNLHSYTTTSPLDIGTSYSSVPVDWFKGSIQEVRIYNRVLTATEVARLYNAGKTVVGSSPTNLVTNGLTAYWTFDGADTNWTANTTTDVSGNGHTGTLTNMTSASSAIAGKFGQALWFNGVNTNVSVPASTALDFTSGSFSVAAWTYVKSVTPGQFFLFDGQGCSQWASWILSLGGDEDTSSRSNKYTFIFRTSNNDTPKYTVSSANNAVAGKWVYLVATYNGSNTLSLYVDGVLSGTAAASGHPYATTQNLYMGEDPGCSGRNQLTGGLDNVRLYHRQLSASEIEQLYNAGANSFKIASSNTNILTNGLVGFWSFDGNEMNWTKNQALDASGNGNNGTLVGMSTTSSPVAGVIGQALKFKYGTANYVSVPPSSSINNLGPFSFSLWLKYSPQSAPYLLNKCSGSSGWYFGPNWYNYFQFRFCGSSQTGPNMAGLPNVTDGLWHNIVVTVDGTATATSTLKEYIDGTFMGTYSASPAPGHTSDASVPLTIGDQFGGDIDNVRLYNRVLSATEVQQLYNLGK